MLYYIYCIWVKTEDGLLRYYGHTQNMTVRKGVHVSNYKRWVAAGKPEKVSEVTGISRSVFVLDHEDWRMDKVDKIECEDKKDAEKLEGEWILKYECVNMNVAGRTFKEYREANKEKIAEQKKEFYESNKEKINKQKKEYREANKEKIAEQRKKKRELNKEKIAEQKAKQVTCEVCGSVVRKNDMARHYRTKKHISAME